VPKVDRKTPLSRLKVALRELAAPSFPKAAFAAALLCGLILFKYRTPQYQPAHTVRTRPVASKKVAVAPKKDARIQLSPVPLMGNPPAEKIAPVVVQKKKLVRRRVAKKAAPSEAMKKFFLAAAKVEPTFDWPEVDESELAVNVASPLDELTERELAKDSEEEAAGSINLVSLTPQEAPAPMPELNERRLQVVIGEIRQHDFADIKSELEAQKEEFAQIAPPSQVPEIQKAKPEPELVRPEPTLVRAKVKPAKKIAKVKKVEIEPELVAVETKPPTPKAAPVQTTPVTTADLNAYFANMGSLGGDLTPARAKAPVTTHPSVAPVTSQVSAVAVPEQRVAATDKNVLVTPTPGRAALPPSQIVVPPPAEPISKPSRLIEENLKGVFEPSNWVIEKMEERNLIVELSLFPEGARESATTIPLGYKLPGEEFEYEAAGLVGNYRLQAVFYHPSNGDFVSRVFYKGTISAASQNQYIHFTISEADYRDAEKSHQSQPANGVWYTANVYKVDTGKLKPKQDGKADENRVTQGEISFVGFPEWGSTPIQSDGTFKKLLPARSELIAKITAPGFYPSYRVIPTFSSPTHAFIYLAHEAGLDPMIRYFTGRPQAKLPVLSPGIVFGRLFDPTSILKPMELVPVEIFPSTVADPLLPATTETGFYGFTNVGPSMRAISIGPDQHRMLVNVPEGSAQYLERGRGGQRDFVGRLMGMFAEPMSVSRVKLAGDHASMETWSDDTGAFRITNIDFQAGVVTVEVKAPGFPRTWYTFSWDGQQPERSRDLFMVSSSKMEEELASHRKLPKVHEHLGRVIGALSKDFFRGEDCTYVQLIGIDGKDVSLAQGPYPFAAGERDESNPRCFKANGSHDNHLAFYNLRDGEYELKVTSKKGKLLRAHDIRVGNNGIVSTFKN